MEKVDEDTHYRWQKDWGAPLFKALVVDDSSTLRRLMGLTLRPLRIDVDYADNGEDAITLVQSNDYDIIFLDVTLPGIDGYHVCKEVKTDIKTKGIPVIMLTGRDSVFDKVRGTMAGADVYLTKPIAPNKLLAAINKYLPVYLSAGEHVNPAVKHSA